MNACNKWELWSKVPVSFHLVLAQRQQFLCASKTKISYIISWQSTGESDTTILLPYAKICKELKKMDTWILTLSCNSSVLPKYFQCSKEKVHTFTGLGLFWTQLQNVYLSKYISEWKMYMQDHDHHCAKEKKILICKMTQNFLLRYDQVKGRHWKMPCVKMQFWEEKYYFRI